MVSSYRILIFSKETPDPHNQHLFTKTRKVISQWHDTYVFKRFSVSLVKNNRGGKVLCQKKN